MDTTKYDIFLTGGNLQQTTTLAAVHSAEIRISTE
jgi:hypothetical protein